MAKYKIFIHNVKVYKYYFTPQGLNVKLVIIFASLNI